MIARVTKGQMSPEKLDEFVGWWHDNIAGRVGGAEGIESIDLLVDRETGKMQGVALWESREAMEAAMPIMAPLMQQVAEIFGASPQVEIWEVAAQI